MNPHQWFLMGLTGNQPNTFIGGVASTINTAQLLADKLLNINDTTFSASNIENFTVIGNDIQCFIKVDYRIAADAFRDNLDIKYYKDTGNKLKFLAFRVFQGANNMTEFEAEGLQQITGGLVFSNTAIKNYIFPNLTIVDSVAFAHANVEPVPQTFYYLPIVQNLGRSVSSDDVVFGNIKPGSIIITNPALQTVNDGAEDEDLVRARNFGAEIRYVTNFTAPNPVTDLAVSQVWEDAVKLSWTTPSSTNAIDYYELYQNGIFVKNVTGNEAIAANLQPSTNYTFKLIAVDIFFNKSTDSNVVSQTTNALGSGRLIDPLVPKLISSYRLNSDLVDVVNGHNGTGTDITYAAGKVGNAAVFNGSSSFISVADQNDFSFTDGTNDKPFSISMWVKYAGTGDGWLINKRSGGTSNLEWQLIKFQGKLGLFLFSANSNATYKVSEIAFSPVVGTWYHFAVTYDGVNYPKIYINAVLQATTNTTTGTYTAMQNTNAPIILGKAGWDNRLYFNGSQDAVHIFNTELTATEISDLYAFEDAGGQLI